MPSSSARALLVGDGYLFGADDMIGRPDVPDTVADDLVTDYVWGTGAIFPVAVTLDYTWLVQRLAWRPVSPVNSQSVSKTGGGSAYATNASSIAEYGTSEGSPITLETAVDADPLALATWITAYQAGYLQRPPQLTIDLLPLATAEQWRVLSITEGTRVILASTPTGWPAECLSVFVDGIAHVVGLDQRLVVFTCSPLVGQAAGQVGPWFMADRSMADGTDVAPF